MKAIKADLIHMNAGKHFKRNIFISIAISVLLLANHFVVAQDEKDSTSKIAFTLTLGSQVSNGSRVVKIKVSRKENKKTIVVNDVTTPFHLYLDEVKPFDASNGKGLISKCQLNLEGEGIFELPKDFYKRTAALPVYTFIVSLNSDLKYENAEESIKITDAKISMEYNGADSVKTAQALLMAWNDSAGTYLAVPQAEVKLCIKRTFNFLLFGEAGAVTDAAGQVSGELPLDIPGNGNGTLTIFGRLEEDENYGTVEGGISVPWTVLPKKNPETRRTLWSSGGNAPLLLVISSVAIITIIWGIIFYLLYLLIKIKRLGKSL
jgi:hypothetical protein